MYFIRRNKFMVNLKRSVLLWLRLENGKKNETLPSYSYQKKLLEVKINKFTVVFRPIDVISC